MTYLNTTSSRDLLPDAVPFSSLSLSQQKSWAVKNPIAFFRYVNSLPYDAAKVAKFPFYKTRICTFIGKIPPSQQHDCSFAHDIAEEWLYADIRCKKLGLAFRRQVCDFDLVKEPFFHSLERCSKAHHGDIMIVHNPTRLIIV